MNIIGGGEDMGVGASPQSAKGKGGLAKPPLRNRTPKYST